MSATVYALAVGAYSDYHIKALFPTEELAEEAVKANKGDDRWHDESRVEAFILYDEIPERITVYRVQEVIWDNGETTDYRADESTNLPWNQWYDFNENGRPEVRYVRAPVHRNKGGRLEVSGTDQQAVNQAFGDDKAKLLAKAAGI